MRAQRGPVIELERRHSWRLALANALGDVPVVLDEDDYRWLIVAPAGAYNRYIRTPVPRGWPTEHRAASLAEELHEMGYPRP